MSDNLELTMMFKKEESEKNMTKEEVLIYVKKALQDKGYNPINQLVGYFISGDPTYITSQDDARTTITKYERDELLEELVEFYIKNKGN